MAQVLVGYEYLGEDPLLGINYYHKDVFVVLDDGTGFQVIPQELAKTAWYLTVR